MFPQNNKHKKRERDLKILHKLLVWRASGYKLWNVEIIDIASFYNSLNFYKRERERERERD